MLRLFDALLFMLSMMSLMRAIPGGYKDRKPTECERGPRGDPGPRGPRGQKGPNGDKGAIGDPSPPTTSMFANLFHYGLLDQPIAPGSNVPFGTVQATSSGFSLTTEEITFLRSGMFLVNYNVDVNVSNRARVDLALFLNGSEVPFTRYISFFGAQPVIGQAIITAYAGDVLTLKNVSDGVSFDLPVNPSYSTANAAITIVRVGLAPPASNCSI